MRLYKVYLFNDFDDDLRNEVIELVIAENEIDAKEKVLKRFNTFNSVEVEPLDSLDGYTIYIKK